MRVGFDSTRIFNMYTKEATKELQKLTVELIKKEKNNSLSKKEVSSLRDVLRFHEYRYYILTDPLISDFEYDNLFKGLDTLERSDPSLVIVDSPTQRVAKG
ncbi:MAG TPA: hypothetical protein VMZ03_07025, partial [Chitinophagaceae bacterium]|nr:hypothetical protein [Chitinophagaceae bacterium]